jgi:UV DNA damage repair endonuclease
MANFEGSKKVYSQLSDEEKIDKLRILYDEGYKRGEALFIKENPQYTIPKKSMNEQKEDKKESISNKLFREAVKNRLTLENDESYYSIVDLYKVFEETGVPICWDSHHHSFNDGGISNEESLQKCIKSWNSIKPLTHLSNTDPTLVNGSFTDRRKHSNYVHYIPDCQFQANNNDEIDIEMEFKMKNIALMKASKDFKLKLS